MRVRVASAGTGKTTRLVRSVLERVRAGTPLRRIAGVTFTRAAADELRQRVAAALEEVRAEQRYAGAPFELDAEGRRALDEAAHEIDGATLTTIHGFMIGALRLTAPTLGIDPDFRMMGEWEAQAIFEEEFAGLAYLATDPDHPLHEAVARLGPTALERLAELYAKRSLAEHVVPDASDEARALVAVWEAVVERVRVRLGRSVLPVSEVEQRALRLADARPAVARVAARFPVVFVDEFQDVNPVQGRFFARLERAGVDLEVVGDPKQSIYGFRNADVGVFRAALDAGDALPPLTTTYRHAPPLVDLLNHLTGRLAERGRGFRPQEAPPVRAAQPSASGRAEFHWVAADTSIAELRPTEGVVLAERLRAAHDEGVAWTEMAVLARGHASLEAAEGALRQAGIPVVRGRGRGYYQRTEVRDLVHALRVGVDARGASFAAWLRGPFAAVPLPDVDAILRADAPLEALARRAPAAADRLERIGELVRGAPLTALKRLIRDPLLDGRSYLHVLTRAQRANVDALLFTVAQQPPRDLEALLERLEVLSRQTDAGDVPQAGDGVELVTVHGAKGLEWRLVAVYDAGRGTGGGRPPVLVDAPEPEGGGPGDAAARLEGTVSVTGSPNHAAAARRRAQREAAEDERLLYVALSRARERLLVTGSAGKAAPGPWTSLLEAVGLGPSAPHAELAGTHVTVHAPRPDVPAGAATIRDPSSGGPSFPELAAWTDRRWAPHPHPPLQSPSGVAEAATGSDPDAAGRAASPPDEEPMRLGDPADGERLPGRAVAVGTLVHDAISKNWVRPDARALANLRSQEVLFPFRDDEREAILAEVVELLGRYRAMLGAELPALEGRDADEAELPVALPQGPTVWQGVIDRLVRVGDDWLLDDYKTDRTVEPDRYAFQLATYVEAVHRVRGIRPAARLVYLRHGRVEALGPEVLEAAWRAGTGSNGRE